MSYYVVLDGQLVPLRNLAFVSLDLAAPGVVSRDVAYRHPIDPHSPAAQQVHSQPSAEDARIGTLTHSVDQLTGIVEGLCQGEAAREQMYAQLMERMKVSPHPAAKSQVVSQADMADGTRIQHLADGSRVISTPGEVRGETSGIKREKAASALSPTERILRQIMAQPANVQVDILRALGVAPVNDAPHGEPPVPLWPRPQLDQPIAEGSDFQTTGGYVLREALDDLMAELRFYLPDYDAAMAAAHALRRESEKIASGPLMPELRIHRPPIQAAIQEVPALITLRPSRDSLEAKLRCVAAQMLALNYDFASRIAEAEHHRQQNAGFAQAPRQPQGADALHGL